MQNLSRRRAWNLSLGNERHCTRALVAGHLVAAPVEYRGFGRLRVLEHDENGVHRLAPFLVRHAEHSDILDAGVARQQAFDLARVHVLAAADDHVTLAVDQIDEAVLIAPRHVANAAIAVAQRFDPIREFVFDDQCMRMTMLSNVLDLGGDQTEIDRHRH